MPSPEERAASILTENRFLSFATVDAGHPWIAPLNYVIGPGRHLHFYSATGARHSRPLPIGHAAAAIFDSRATSEEVAGMQFSALCSEVTGDDVDAVHGHYFEVNFSDPEERQRWLRPSDAFKDNGPLRFYHLLPQEIFVTDVDAIEQDHLHRRASVDMDEMWQLVAALLS
jgi:hypothetical protein